MARLHGRCTRRIGDRYGQALYFCVQSQAVALAAYLQA
jgi:hypothetical protein